MKQILHPTNKKPTRSPLDSLFFFHVLEKTGLFLRFQDSGEVKCWSVFVTGKLVIVGIFSKFWSNYSDIDTTDFPQKVAGSVSEGKSPKISGKSKLVKQLGQQIPRWFGSKNCSKFPEEKWMSSRPAGNCHDHGWGSLLIETILVSFWVATDCQVGKNPVLVLRTRWKCTEMLEGFKALLYVRCV